MKKSKLKLSTIKQVLKYVKRYTPLLILSILFATATVALTLYIPIVIGQAIDLLANGAGTVDRDAVWNLLLRVGIIAVIIGLLQWIMSNINNKITEMFVTRRLTSFKGYP